MGGGRCHPRGRRGVLLKQLARSCLLSAWRVSHSCMLLFSSVWWWWWCACVGRGVVLLPLWWAEAEREAMPLIGQAHIPSLPCLFPTHLPLGMTLQANG